LRHFQTSLVLEPLVHLLLPCRSRISVLNG
jgi:hypothetical protein